MSCPASRCPQADEELGCWASYRFDQEPGGAALPTRRPVSALSAALLHLTGVRARLLSPDVPDTPHQGDGVVDLSGPAIAGLDRESHRQQLTPVFRDFRPSADQTPEPRLVPGPPTATRSATPSPLRSLSTGPAVTVGVGFGAAWAGRPGAIAVSASATGADQASIRREVKEVDAAGPTPPKG